MMKVVVEVPKELADRVNRYPKGEWKAEGKDISILDDRYYTEKHMWAKKTSEGYFKVGVTDYAQRVLWESAQANAALLEIFKTAGDEVEAGEVFGTVYGSYYANFDYVGYEAMAFDLTAPVSGRIIRVNCRVIDNPKLINISPYEEGWIAIIDPKDPQSDLYDLIPPMKYKNILTRKERSPFRIV